MNEHTITRQIEIKAPVAKVWDALVDYKKFGTWFRVNLESPFVVGKKNYGHITWPGYEDVKWEAEVKAMETNKLFSFSWPHGKNYEDNPNSNHWTLVEFRLEEIPGGTLLTVTESGLEKLPPDRRSEAYRDNSGGWSIQVKNIKEFTEGRTKAAQDFLTMVAAGKVSDAYKKFIADDFVHHNQYFKGDRQSLMTAMIGANETNPNKKIDIRKVHQDGDTVMTMSHVKQNPDDLGGAVVHIYRFEGDKVVELWDVGQQLAKDSPNKNGPF